MCECEYVCGVQWGAAYATKILCFFLRFPYIHTSSFYSPPERFLCQHSAPSSWCLLNTNDDNTFSPRPRNGKYPQCLFKYPTRDAAVAFVLRADRIPPRIYRMCGRTAAVYLWTMVRKEVIGEKGSCGVRNDNAYNNRPSSCNDIVTRAFRAGHIRHTRVNV